MSYEELASVFDKINEIAFDRLTDKERGELYKVEAEALKSFTLYADGEPIKTIVDEVFEPFTAFCKETERMFER